MISDSNVSRLSNVETGFLFPWFVKIYNKGILGSLISLLVFFKVFLNHSTLEHKYILYVLCHVVKKKKIWGERTLFASPKFIHTCRGFIPFFKNVFLSNSDLFIYVILIILNARIYDCKIWKSSSWNEFNHDISPEKTFGMTININLWRKWPLFILLNTHLFIHLNI